MRSTETATDPRFSVEYLALAVLLTPMYVILQRLMADPFFRPRMVGFATLAARHVEIDDLPERARKKLPRYPVPAVSLARLAVDSAAQSKGIGGQLLRFVLNIAAKMASEVGCAGIIVDAKPGAIAFYARYGFQPIELLEGESEERPRPMAMWLGMKALRFSANCALEDVAASHEKKREKKDYL